VRADDHNRLRPGGKRLGARPRDSFTQITMALGHKTQSVPEPAAHIWFRTALETNFELHVPPFGQRPNTRQCVLGHFTLKLRCAFRAQSRNEPRLGATLYWESSKQN